MATHSELPTSPNAAWMPPTAPNASGDVSPMRRAMRPPSETPSIPVASGVVSAGVSRRMRGMSTSST
jgi:hypothetical protein